MGNFFTLRDLLDKGYSPEAIRYLLISNHYRQQLNFTFEGLKAAATSVDRLKSFKGRVEEIVSKNKKGIISENVESIIKKSLEKFDDSLCDDLNISPALAAIFDLMNNVNKLIGSEELNSKESEKILETIERFNVVLGIFENEKVEIPEDILNLVEERKEAKASKNYKLSDEIRDKIIELGYIIEDTKDGTRVKKA
jgi:cysteinyl-tRNA synthetase